MILLYLKFYYVDQYPPPDKMPVKSVRMDHAFINEKVPGVAAYPVTKKTFRKPDRSLWDVKLKMLRLATYPTINNEEWFTYKKNGAGKVKRVTLNQYLQKGASK